MTIAPEIRSWLDWGADVGESVASLPLPERREPLRFALDDELRRRGVAVEPVGAVDEHPVGVAGGEIRVRVFTPPDHPSVALYGEGYGLDRVDMDSYGESYLASPADGSDPYASPLLAADLGGVAPAHVLTAEYDILRDSGEAYARRLEEDGVETTLHRLPGHTHGSSALWQWWEPARQWMDEVIAALEQALHRATAERR